MAKMEVCACSLSLYSLQFIFCFIFRESKTSWDQEIRDDVIEECSKHGGVLHIFVDKASTQGNVYVKCPTIAAAVASVNSLHGRYFGGMYLMATGSGHTTKLL